MFDNNETTFDAISTNSLEHVTGGNMLGKAAQYAAKTVLPKAGYMTSKPGHVWSKHLEPRLLRETIHTDSSGARFTGHGANLVPHPTLGGLTYE